MVIFFDALDSEDNDSSLSSSKCKKIKKNTFYPLIESRKLHRWTDHHEFHHRIH